MFTASISHCNSIYKTEDEEKHSKSHLMERYLFLGTCLALMAYPSHIWL